MKKSPYYLNEGIHQVNGTSYLGRTLSLEVMFDLIPIFLSFPSFLLLLFPASASACLRPLLIHVEQ